MEIFRELSEEELKLVNDYIETALEELEAIKVYLEENNWRDEPDADKQKEKFKFQTTVQKSRMTWLEQVLKYSGIIEYYNKTRGAKKKTLKKSSSNNSVMDMLKNGGLTDE